MSTLPARQTGGSVVAVSLDNINMDLIDKSLKDIEGKTGERAMQKGGGARLFPGQLYTFNKDRGYLLGAGKKGVEIDDPQFVVNFLHMAVVWQRWGESKNGKPYPIFSDLCIPAAGDDIVERESLGFLNPEGEGEEGEPGYEAPWTVGTDKKPIDPWKLLVVFPVRNAEPDEATDENGDPVNPYTYGHIQADNKTNRQLFYTFMKETAAEAKLKPGMLPVVQFGVAELSKPAVMKGKRVIQQGMEWKAMSMDIIDWVPAMEIDQLNQRVEMGEASGDDGDMPEATVTQRVPAQKALPPPAVKAAAKAPAVKAAAKAPAVKAAAKAPAPAAQSKGTVKVKAKKSAPADL